MGAQRVEGQFNPGLFNPRPFNPKSGVEKSGVEKFMVEKSGVERSGVEKSGVDMSFNQCAKWSDSSKKKSYYETRMQSFNFFVLKSSENSN